MIIRILLGIAEGGMMPGVAYYLSTWYTRDELALRIGIFGTSIVPPSFGTVLMQTIVSAASMAGAFGGLLATAFLSIPQIGALYVDKSVL